MPDPFLALFVPANRPDRYTKAATAGADAIVIDLEDAVAPSERHNARADLVKALGVSHLSGQVFVRVNSAETADFHADMEAMDQLPHSVGMMLAKAEDGTALNSLKARFKGRALIGLVETPRGIETARQLARACDLLAFGSIDFANAIGARHNDRALLWARSELVLACASVGRPAPIDGVTTSIADHAIIAEESAAARELGFRGKLLIHPGQVIPALRGMAPPAPDVEEARQVLAMATASAVGVGGKMVDAPVILAARRTVDEYETIERRLEAILGDAQKSRQAAVYEGG